MMKTAQTRLFTINFIFICLATFSLMLVFYGLNSTLPIYNEKFSGSVKYAGLAMTSLTIAAILARLIGGYLLDRFGRQIVLIAGIVVFLIPTIFYTWMVPVIALIALRFLQGWGWGVGHTAINTVAMDVTPREKLGQGMGIYTLSFSTSMALAPAIALWFIYNYPFWQLFIMCALLTLFALVLALMIKYPRIKVQPAPFNLKGFVEKEALRPAVTGFIVIFANSAVMSFLPLFAENIGLTEAGVCFTAMALTAFLSRPFAGLVLDKIRGEKGYSFNVILAVAMMIAAILVVSRATLMSHLLAAGLILGVGNGIIQTTLMVVTVDSAPASKKGREIATYWAFVDSGVAAGSLCWGLVAAACGFRLMYVLAAIPLLAALAVFFTWRSRSEVRQSAAGGDACIVKLPS